MRGVRAPLVGGTARPSAGWAGAHPLQTLKFMTYNAPCPSPSPSCPLAQT